VYLIYPGRVMILNVENYQQDRQKQKAFTMPMYLIIFVFLSACSTPPSKSNQFAIDFAKNLSAQHPNSVIWEGNTNFRESSFGKQVYPNFEHKVIASVKERSYFVGGLSVSGSTIFTLKKSSRADRNLRWPFTYPLQTLLTKGRWGGRGPSLSNRFEKLLFSERAQCAAALTPSDTLFLFEPDGGFIQDRERTISNVTAFTFAPKQPLLTVVQAPSWFGSESTFTTYNTHTWEIESQFKMEGDFVDIAYSPNGRRLISAQRDGELRVFEANANKLLYAFDVVKPVQTILAMEGTNNVAIQEDDNTISIWDYTKKLQLNSLYFEHDIEDFAFSNESRILVLGTDSNEVQYWRIADQELLYVIEHSGSMVGVEVLAEDGLLVSSSFGGDLIVSEIPFGDFRKTFKQKIEKAWTAFYAHEYRRNASRIENQKSAKALIKETLKEVLGAPVIQKVSFDRINQAYQLDVVASLPSAWTLKLPLSIDARDVAHLPDPLVELPNMEPQLVLNINSNGMVTLNSAFVVSSDKTLQASVNVPFTPLNIPPQLASVFSGGSVEVLADVESIPDTRNDLALGNYHALVIGNNDYKEYPDLKTAVLDVNVIGSVLSETYGFEVAQLVDATRADILGALDNYRRTLSNEDNLLVYYAGHGIYDDETDRGYWLPVDATKNSSYDWISNADLTDRLKAIKAKHVMVVADSCYSGTLTRGLISRKQDERYWKRISRKKSRTVLTSGGLEPVLDGGGGSHSVFANAFIQTLKQNQTLLDGTELFEKVRKRVIRNADQTPQYSDIRFAGHEGGDFIFKQIQGQRP